MYPPARDYINICGPVVVNCDKDGSAIVGPVTAS